MKLVNNNKYFTIEETARIWKDLSPNMKAKIHQWMSRKLFKPELYNPPRTKRPCLLGIADEVAIPILHWLFFIGVRYGNVFKGSWPGEYDWKLSWGKNVTGDSSYKLPLYERRPLQAFLELNEFDVVVHTWPCFAVRSSWGMPKPALQEPKMLLEHTVHLVRREDLDSHLEKFRAEYADKPSTMIDAKAIHEETLRRIKRLG
ncbi:MAG: hypothetical protein ACLQPD_12115 [Desulfomonilaceae bacterium]